MKSFLLSASLLCFFSASAQKGLNEMIAAEKSFAAYSIAHGTKEAFLQFIDTGAVMFEKGVPVNGFQLWTNKEKRPGVLAWHPRFAEISGSGDYGYTCGPWTFQQQLLTDSIIASGYFFTVWQKKSGNWKAILDIGTDTGPQLADSATIKVAVSKSVDSKTSLLKAEKDFIDKHNKEASKAYEKFLSPNTVLCRNGWTLTSTPSEHKKLIAGLPRQIQFTVQGSGIAPAGDLGFVYGNVSANGKKDNYLHIWRREQKEWKLALQLLRL